MDEKLEQDLDIKQEYQRLRRLARHVWIHFQEDRCLEEAASLSYTSLLSMVPLLAVMFGIISAFPVFDSWSARLQAFIFDNFLPSTGEQIAPYIDTFLNSVSGLTLPGTTVLIITALLLMIRIETAFNRIWRVERARTWVNRVVMYWAVLTLGPILIAAAIAISAQQVFGAIGVDGNISPGLYSVGMFLLTWLLISMVFVLVPNRSVRIKHALAGAFLSAVLFTIVKSGFVAYVSNTNYSVIYGALATIPIFLFWIYLVWIVILFGASLAASLTTFADYRRYESSWPSRWGFQLSFRLLGHFWRAQREGKALSYNDLLELEKSASELQLERQVLRLCDAHILAADEAGDWLLVRDLGDMTLGDLYRCGDYYLPLGETEDLPRDTPLDGAFVDSLETISGHAGPVWEQSLREIYKSCEESDDAEKRS